MDVRWWLVRFGPAHQMTAAKNPARRRAVKRVAPKARGPKAADPTVHRPVVEAGPVAVHVAAGEVAVVVAPPAPGGIDRRLFTLINGLPHSTTSDRYVSVLSDLGEGLGWVAGGAALAMLGGAKGRRAGVATALASLAATYVVQARGQPPFRPVRPFGNPRAPEGRPADPEQNAPEHIARPVGPRPYPCQTGQHDHDRGQCPKDWTDTRSEPRRERKGEHEAEPGEEDGVPAGEAEAGGRVENVEQVGGRALSRDRELDDVVEPAGDAADQQQPPGAALDDEQRDHRDGPNQDLAEARAYVDQLHRIDLRAPVDRPGERRNRDVNRQRVRPHAAVGAERAGAR